MRRVNGTTAPTAANFAPTTDMFAPTKARDAPTKPAKAPAIPAISPARVSGESIKLTRAGARHPLSIAEMLLFFSFLSDILSYSPYIALSSVVL